MNEKYKENFPKNFPKELFNSAQSLEHLGILEVAWDWKNALKVVDLLSLCNYVVLGGDVYSLVNGKLQSTCDNWYIDNDRIKKRDEIIRKACTSAINYITQYHNRNGEDFYYSIVFDK